MTILASLLEARGYHLRSGCAEGSDTAFEVGVSNPTNMSLYVPWKGFAGKPMISTITQATMEMAYFYYHFDGIKTGWFDLKQGIQKLMARNCHQVVGPNLDLPSDFVLCWTPDGCETWGARSYRSGGTGQAIAVAADLGISVYNLANPGRLEAFMKEWLC